MGWGERATLLTQRDQAVHSALGSYKKGSGYRCPACNPPNAAPLSVTIEGDKLLLHCNKCDAGFTEIIDAMGMTPVPTVKPDVALLASKWGLPEEFLAGRGIKNSRYGGVTIPSLNRDGSPLSRKVRTKLHGGDKYRNVKGQKAAPYGLDTINGHKAVFVTEGESDALTLIYHKLPAIGLPGSTNTGCLSLDMVKGVDTLALLPDSDEAGALMPERLSDRLEEIGWDGVLQIGDLPNGKDINEMYLEDKLGFIHTLNAIKLTDYGEEDLWEMVDGNTEIVLPTFIEDYYVVKGSLNLAVGDAATGKTAFMLDRTRMWMKQGYKVAWAGYEDPIHLKAKISMVGVPVPYINCLADERFSWGNGGLEVLMRQVKRSGVDILVIDSLFGAVGAAGIELNSAKEILPILTRIDKFCSENNITIVLVHHFNKGGTGKGGSVAGSAQIRARCRGGYMFVRITDESDLDGLTVVAVGQAKESYSAEVRPKRMELLRVEDDIFPKVTVEGEFDESIEILQWGEQSKRNRGKGVGAPGGNTNAMKADTAEAMASLERMADPDKMYTTKDIHGMISNDTSLGAYDKGVENAIRVAKRKGMIIKTTDPFGNIKWKVVGVAVEMPV